MIGLLVSGHGNFATGLATSLKLLAGEQANTKYVDFDGASGDDLKVKIAETLDTMKEYDGILVLTDLPGGTPYNKSVELKLERAADQTIEVMAGTNLPLLLSCATMAAMFEAPMDLAQAMLPEAKDSLVVFELEADDDDNDDFGDFI